MFHVPSAEGNSRFEQRLNDYGRIGDALGSLLPQYDVALILHVSNGFGLAQLTRPTSTKVCIFPMFTGVSYRLSGEHVPPEYLHAEADTLRSCDGILTPSPTEAEQIRAFYGVPLNRMKVVARGIDTRLFRPLGTRKAMNSHRLQLVYLATIKPQKNQHDCVPLVACLRDMGAHATVHLVGGIGCTDYYSQLLTAIRRGQLDEHFVFHGLQPRNTVAAIVRKCDYGISLSRIETFGKGIYETMAAGLPTFVYDDVRAVWDYLKDGEGVMAVGRSADQMARHILQLHSCKTSAKEMRRLARQSAQRFNEHTCMTQLCDALHALCDQ